MKKPFEVIAIQLALSFFNIYFSFSREIFSTFDDEKITYDPIYGPEGIYIRRNIQGALDIPPSYSFNEWNTFYDTPGMESNTDNFYQSNFGMEPGFAAPPNFGPANMYDNNVLPENLNGYNYMPANVFDYNAVPGNNFGSNVADRRPGNGFFGNSYPQVYGNHDKDIGKLFAPFPPLGSNYYMPNNVKGYDQNSEFPNNHYGEKQKENVHSYQNNDPSLGVIKVLLDALVNKTNVIPQKGNDQTNTGVPNNDNKNSIPNNSSKPNKNEQETSSKTTSKPEKSSETTTKLEPKVTSEGQTDSNVENTSPITTKNIESVTKPEKISTTPEKDSKTTVTDEAETSQKKSTDLTDKVPTTQATKEANSEQKESEDTSTKLDADTVTSKAVSNRRYHRKNIFRSLYG